MRLRNINQAQLAKGIGVKPPSVSAWLKGRIRDGKPTKVFPDYETLERICAFLECTPADLIKVDPKAVRETWRDFRELAVA